VRLVGLATVLFIPKFRLDLSLLSLKFGLLCLRCLVAGLPTRRQLIERSQQLIDNALILLWNFGFQCSDHINQLKALKPEVFKLVKFGPVLHLHFEIRSFEF
jgi:hypothetical protein